MSDEFRPERFVISPGFAQVLDADGLTVSTIRHHENGSVELELEPARDDASDDPPDSDELVMDGFIAGCLRSGMQENVCVDCGRPWLTRSDEKLCPVCNPDHVGYHPGGAPPHDKARWVLFWRSHFTGVLRARAADHQHRRRLLEHAEATSPTVYPPDATAARLIYELDRVEPSLDERDQEWRDGWSRGFDR